MTELEPLIALIEPEAKALGFDLVRVVWIGSGDELTLQIMAERPQTRQLLIEDCAELSRRISDKFDEIDPIEEAYRLEVSSPGIDRPLTRLSDFADWVGHETKLSLIDGVDGRNHIRGNIESVEGDNITLQNAKFGSISFAYSDVKKAKLTLTDRLIASTAPLASDGVDDVETDDTPEEQEKD